MTTQVSGAVTTEPDDLGLHAIDSDADAVEPSIEDIAAVSDRFIKITKSFNRIRSQFLAAAQHDVEWSAHVLIAHLVNEGPMRSSALAELVQSDPSTVSRQVANLVRDGYVVRQADAGDGRATLLVATEKSHQVFQEHRAIRTEAYRRMLKGWSADECATFARLLGRFNDVMDKTNFEWFTDAANRAGSTEGNNE